MYSTKRNRDYATKQLSERLWAKTRKIGDCIEWRGTVNNKGYGLIGTGSRTDGSRRLILVHRAAWELKNGRQLNKGEALLHTCDNPRCVNAEHLKLGTQLENIKDCVAKGRHAKGSVNGHAKLSEIDIPKIFELFNQGKSSDQIGEFFGVSRTAINHVRAGRTWRHVRDQVVGAL